MCILTTQAIMKLLKSKEAAAAVDVKSWPLILDTGEEILSHTLLSHLTDVLCFTFIPSPFLRRSAEKENSSHL